jgi:hypothetical protein
LGVRSQKMPSIHILSGEKVLLISMARVWAGSSVLVSAAQ